MPTDSLATQLSSLLPPHLQTCPNTCPYTCLNGRRQPRHPAQPTPTATYCQKTCLHTRLNAYLKTERPTPTMSAQPLPVATHIQSLPTVCNHASTRLCMCVRVCDECMCVSMAECEPKMAVTRLQRAMAVTKLQRRMAVTKLQRRMAVTKLQRRMWQRHLMRSRLARPLIFTSKRCDGSSCHEDLRHSHQHHNRPTLGHTWQNSQG